MPQDFLIGRNPVSALKIPSSKIEVSGEHLRIKIDENGIWSLEDLDSTNGTFLRDENGDFQQVFQIKIKETDIIRLGHGGANSYTFTARRILNEDDTYEYEFRQLKKKLKTLKEEESKKEKRIEIYGWIAKFSGLGAVGICAIIGSFKGVNIDPTIRYIAIACAPILVGVFLNGPSKSLKKMKKLKQKIMICPHCGSPLADFDIEGGQCSRCKAK